MIQVKNQTAMFAFFPNRVQITGPVQIPVTGKPETGLNFGSALCGFARTRVEIRTCTQFRMSSSGSLKQRTGSAPDQAFPLTKCAENRITMHMANHENAPADFPLLNDEELAALCARGIDGAERELLRRHMQAIYWLPRQAFGAPEEELSGFLIYAIEKIRKRDILGKFDPDQNTRFATWFGVVIRRLYLDYLRSQQQHEPFLHELREDTAKEPETDSREPEESLITRMQIRCRALFKLLLCNTHYLEADEIRWIAEQSGRSALDVARDIAELEERLRNAEVRMQQRYDRISVAFHWKNIYERQLQRLEKELEHPWTADHGNLEKIRRKLERRQQEYLNLVRELSGSAGIVTAPYRDLAGILGIKEGTLASQISRCRAGAAEIAGKPRNRETES